MEDPSTRLKNLVEKANDFNVDHKIPAVRYLRSSKEMERMALVYASEQENENSFLLYMKLITLLVEKLPKHPLYKSLTPEQKKTIKTRCNAAFLAAEKLKKAVKDQFDHDYKHWQQEKAKSLNEQNDEELERRASNLRLTSMAAVASVPSHQDHDDAGMQRKEPSAPPPPPDIPIGTQIWGPNAAQPQSSTSHHTVKPHLSTTSQARSTQPVAPPSNSAGLPPSYDQAISSQTGHPQQQPTQTYQPASSVPEFDRSAKPNAFHAAPNTGVPQINRDAKPQGYMSRQVSDSLDGNRRIVIPPDLVSRFLQAASSNTQRNIETCGILNGILARNTLRVTHLVIPKQSGTSDSCTTENEEELFEVQDRYDTITLGWIHTHPSQTAFLSSVDLHTQCSYQQLMPEAIAIVCAPKYNTTGMYRLTLDHGLQFIASCNKVGFHPHPKDPPLFEESPLVSTDSNTRIQIVDLR